MLLLQDEILAEALALKAEMLADRRHLHENPELGMELPNTVQFVEAKLKAIGYNEIKHIGQAGLTVTVGSGQGKVFMLRADMDALPILEDNELPFKSKIPGRMHACGHDIHTAMLLAAAKILKRHEAQIPGTVKLMFQPGEEIMKGAQDMIKSGILADPKPDAAAMIHVMPALPYDIGTILNAKGGPTMASIDWFEITIKGRGGHGSMPYLAHDPLVPMAAIQNALHTIQSRDLLPNTVAAVTIGDISGCETSNVIPDALSMGGTIRTYDEAQRVLIKERMQEIVEHICLAYRCEGTVTFPAGAPYFDTNEAVSQHIQNVIPAYLGFTNVPPVQGDIPIMGSEDFAYVSHEVPTGLMLLAASDLRKGEKYNVHHPKVVFNEDCLPYGAAAHVAVAVSWLAANQ